MSVVEKMSKIRSHFNELIQQVPKLILKQIVVKKLHKCGLAQEDESFVTAITEHIISGTEEEFEWDDDKYDDLIISFTEADADEIQKRIDRFLKEGIPAVVQTTITETTKDLVD